MLAVDTNVLIRYMTDDDPAQSAQARNVMEGPDVHICATVLLEAEWV